MALQQQTASNIREVTASFTNFSTGNYFLQLELPMTLNSQSHIQQSLDIKSLRAV